MDAGATGEGEGAAELDVLSDELAVLDADDTFESLGLASTAGALFLPPPSRKSVTYQPVPLS